MWLKSTFFSSKWHIFEIRGSAKLTEGSAKPVRQDAVKTKTDSFEAKKKNLRWGFREVAEEWRPIAGTISNEEMKKVSPSDFTWCQFWKILMILFVIGRMIQVVI